MSELVASEDEEWIIDDDDAVALSACAIAVKPWRVLIVDDEPDIHAVTRMALGKVKFKERSLELLSAYTGAEGYEILAREKDIALVLLEVVMEQAAHNQSRAAEWLGLNRNTLRKKLALHKLL